MVQARRDGKPSEDGGVKQDTIALEWGGHNWCQVRGRDDCPESGWSLSGQEYKSLLLKLDINRIGVKYEKREVYGMVVTW